MSNTPEAIERWIRARGGVLDGEGGSGRRTSSAWGVWRRGAPRPKEKLEQKDGVPAVLTKA